MTTKTPLSDPEALQRILDLQLALLTGFHEIEATHSLSKSASSSLHFAILHASGSARDIEADLAAAVERACEVSNS